MMTLDDGDQYTESRIIVCSVAIVTSAPAPITPRAQSVSRINMLSWTDLDCQSEKGHCNDFQLKNCPTCCTLLDQMWQRSFSPIFPAHRPHNGTRSGSTRAPVRATSGTFVPHGSERTLGRYLTAPVTLPPPTSDNLLRQGARARVCRTHNCTRGGTCVLHSSVTLPPREVMWRSLSQVHCHILLGTAW